MDLIAKWKMRVDTALGVFGQEKVVFATSLQGKCAEYAKFHDHTGQQCVIIAAVIEPGPNYDEESLPYYRVRFDDGVEFEVGDEELFSKSAAFFGVLTAVSGAFAVARDHGFVGPTHLREEGSDEVKASFEAAFEAYKIDRCGNNFNTPAEFRPLAEPTEEERQLARIVELEGALSMLIEGFDQGSIEGDPESFEAAKVVFQRNGKLTFGNWMARVCSELGVDEVSRDAYRPFYERGLLPAEAVLQERLDAGVMER